MRRWSPIAAVAALCLTLFAVPLRAEQPSTYQVGSGDVLQIAIYAGGEKQEEFSGTVSPVGTVTCPLLGELKVAGMTTYEISKTMTDALAHDFFVLEISYVIVLEISYVVMPATLSSPSSGHVTVPTGETVPENSSCFSPPA